MSQSSGYGALHPRQKQICKSLVENLIKCGLPVSLVDCDGFRKFMSDVDPRFQVPCRQTVSASYLPQLLAEKHSLIADILSSASDVALTIDIWSDRRQHAFLGITAHIFDIAKGVPQSMLLKFQSFREIHSGENIARAVENCICEAGLIGKVHFIVCDNASNMRKAFSFIFAPGPRGNLESWLGAETNQSDQLAVEDSDAVIDDATLYEDVPDLDCDALNAGERIPCFAHSLQLVIRDGLQKVAVSRTAVAKCAKLANMTHQSVKFRASFEDAFGKGRCVPASNDTRWNSVYRQLKSIVDLDMNKLSEVLRKEEQGSLIMTQKELQQVRELVSTLAPFAEATDIAQGTTYITMSYIVPVLLSLLQHLSTQHTSVKYNIPFVRELLSSLFTRFRGIFEQLQIPYPAGVSGSTAKHTDKPTAKNLHFDSNVFVMATCIDPQHGYRWLELHPGSVAEKEVLKNRIFSK